MRRPDPPARRTIDPAWLGTLQAAGRAALGQLRAYIVELATLWWWTHEAMDGAVRGCGQQEIRTRQRGGNLTAERLSPGQADPKEVDDERHDAVDHRPASARAPVAVLDVRIRYGA